MADDSKCPGDATFSPLTYASLLKMNAFRRDVLTPPDWAFFIGVLLCFMALILLTIIVVSYVMKKDWSQNWLPVVMYQKTNYTRVENSNPEDKKAIVSINTESSSFTMRAGGDVEEDEDEELLIKFDKGVKVSKKKKNRKHKENVEL